LWRGHRSAMKAREFAPCGAAVALPLPGLKADHEKA
jgi:hypothetical protein